MLRVCLGRKMLKTRRSSPRQRRCSPRKRGFPRRRYVHLGEPGDRIVGVFGPLKRVVGVSYPSR